VTEEETALGRKNQAAMKIWCETALRQLTEAALQNASL